MLIEFKKKKKSLKIKACHMCDTDTENGKHAHTLPM